MQPTSNIAELIGSWHIVDCGQWLVVVTRHHQTSEIIIIPRQCLLWCHHCKSSPSSFECRMAPSGCRPKTKPDNIGCESTCTGCQSLHLPSPFVVGTQPEIWYSFYHPMEGRRLSRASWLVTYRDGLPVHRRSLILVLTGFDVVQLRWSRPNVLPLSQTACRYGCQLHTSLDGVKFEVSLRISLLQQQQGRKIQQLLQWFCLQCIGLVLGMTSSL